MGTPPQLAMAMLEGPLMPMNIPPMHMGFNPMMNMPPFGGAPLGYGNDSYNYSPQMLPGQMSHMGQPMQLGGMPGLGASLGTSSVSVGSNDSVRFIQKLGSGAFGEVWKAEYKGEIVAAKVTSCPMGFRSEEIDILKSAQGQHTVKLIAQEECTPKGTAIIMELYSGSLLDFIAERRGPQTEIEFLLIVEQILEGLQ